MWVIQSHILTGETTFINSVPKTLFKFIDIVRTASLSLNLHKLSWNCAFIDTCISDVGFSLHIMIYTSLLHYDTFCSYTADSNVTQNVISYNYALTLS